MKIELCHTLSTETIQIDVPDTFANDLEHVVAIKDGEAFQLKSTIPDEIKHKNQLRQNFEDTAFEDLRKTYYKDLDEDADPEEFEKDFTSKCRELIYVDDHYKELESILTDEILHTLCVHFVVYAIYKNRDEKLQAKNAEQKSDRCYAKDYAKRLIKLFKSLSFSDPGSIRRFSEELNTLEQFMQGDSRRHAGYDKLFAGISATVTQLASAFITDGREQTINLVKAFEDVASSTDNPDRQKLIAKVSSIINNTIAYYENYVSSIDRTEADIATISDDLPLAYAAVGRGLVVSFINSTDKFLRDVEQKKDASKVSELRKAYKQNLDMFCNYYGDLVAAFDDVTDNTAIPDSVHATNLSYVWFNINKFRSSESETWPTDLAKLLYDNFNQLYKDVPGDLKMHRKSN